MDLHRGDLQRALFNRATELGVKCHFGARVVSIEFEKPEVTLESGAKHGGDLIVGADGLWSRCRECFLNKIDKPMATGDLAYRIVLTLDQIKDQDLRNWVQKPSVHVWMGPNSHAVGYSIRAGQMYNIVLIQPDDLAEDIARERGSVEEMRKLVANWDPMSVVAIK